MSAPVVHCITYTNQPASGASRAGARNPEVLASISHIGLMLQMHNRGEDRRASFLAEGILQRASMYVMNQAYAHPLIPIHNASMLLSMTQAADILKQKSTEVRNGQQSQGTN